MQELWDSDLSPVQTPLFSPKHGASVATSIVGPPGPGILVVTLGSAKDVVEVSRRSQSLHRLGKQDRWYP